MSVNTFQFIELINSSGSREELLGLLPDIDYHYQNDYLLKLAVIRRHLDAVDILLSNAIPPYNLDMDSGIIIKNACVSKYNRKNEPDEFAAESVARLKLVELLIQYGIDVSIDNSESLRLVSLNANYHPGLAVLLIQHGAKICHQTPDLLRHQFIHHHLELIRLFFRDYTLFDKMILNNMYHSSTAPFFKYHSNSTTVKYPDGILSRLANDIYQINGDNYQGKFYFHKNYLAHLKYSPEGGYFY
jgi:hypothetical protein